MNVLIQNTLEEFHKHDAGRVWCEEPGHVVTRAECVSDEASESYWLVVELRNGTVLRTRLASPEQVWEMQNVTKDCVGKCLGGKLLEFIISTTSGLDEQPPQRLRRDV